jgi:hypothetical protein
MHRLVRAMKDYPHPSEPWQNGQQGIESLNVALELVSLASAVMLLCEGDVEMASKVAERVAASAEDKAAAALPVVQRVLDDGVLPKKESDSVRDMVKLAKMLLPKGKV